MATPDEIEDTVLTWLSSQNAATLEKVYQLIPLACPDNLKGKKRSLLKTLLDHFCSLDDDDGGYSTILLIHDFILKLEEETPQREEVVDEKSEVSGRMSGESGYGKSDEKRRGIYEKIDVVKFKEFKISGTIAGKGDNKMSYTSLSYQIEEGKRQGFSDSMICTAVVRAISPGNNLHTYLESKKIVSLYSLIEILQSHFKEKDSSAMYTELGNAVQHTSETCLDFVIRILCLREKVLSLSIEEKCPYDSERLNKTFFHTMFTGMRNLNICNDLHDKCRNDYNIEDELLMKFVAEAVANEAERNEKFVTAKKKMLLLTL